MTSGAAFRTSVAAFVSSGAAFKHSGAAFAAQSRRSSGNSFRNAASFLKTCTIGYCVVSFLCIVSSKCFFLFLLRQTAPKVERKR